MLNLDLAIFGVFGICTILGLALFWVIESALRDLIEVLSFNWRSGP